jgi:hypothetical protein
MSSKTYQSSNNIANKDIVKIKLCTFFLKGTCTHMNAPHKCKFAHGIQDLYIHSYKTTDCKYKTVFNCPYGKTCNHIHVEDRQVLYQTTPKMPSGQELYKTIKKFIENNNAQKAEELCREFFKKWSYDDICLKLSDTQIQDLADCATDKLENI